MQSHIAVIFFGIAGLFGKWLHLPPEIIVFWRTAVAATALFFILKLRGNWIKPKKLSIYFFLGPLLALHWIAFFKSIQLSTVAIGLITFSTFPVFVAILEPLFFKTKSHWYDILAAVIVLGGVSLIVPAWTLNHHYMTGIIWGIGSGLTFAILTIINRRMLQDSPASTITTLQNAFAALTLLPTTLYHFKLPTISEGLLLIILAIFCTALAHWLYIQAMRSISARLASLICTMEPVYGIILAFLLLNEIPNFRTILGGLIIVVTVACVSNNHSSQSTGH
ncbi:EamA family transporter [bacterium]|nr:EamA family transporter [bacterium]